MTSQSSDPRANAPSSIFSRISLGTSPALSNTVLQYNSTTVQSRPSHCNQCSCGISQVPLLYILLGPIHSNHSTSFPSHRLLRNTCSSSPVSSALFIVGTGFPVSLPFLAIDPNKAFTHPLPHCLVSCTRCHSKLLCFCLVRLPNRWMLYSIQVGPCWYVS